MAGNEIRYNVKVDASGANRALSQFGRAARQAGEDAANALDDTASAGEKMRAALQASAEAADAELREAAAAADALRLALGDAADQFDTSQLVAEINRGGVAFDEIRADADKFADTLRQIDGIRVKGVNDGLSKTKTELDGVRNNADQSRSVLANLAGNSAQDLGELGGVVGSLGVGVGQLAEYAVDGNIALSNLAAVAGPMLGLVAATQLVTSQLQNMKQTDAFNTEQAEKWAEAVKESGAEITTLTSEIQESGELLARVGQSNPIGTLFSREETINVIDLLTSAGVTLADITRLYEQYGAAIGAGTLDTDAFKDSLRQLGVADDDVNDVMSGIINNFGAFNTEVAKSQKLARFFASDTDSMTGALGDVRYEAGEVAKAWDTLNRLQYEGKGSSAEALKAWNYLRTELQLSDQQMADTFNANYNQFLDEQAEKLEASRAEAEKLTAAVAEYGRVVSSADWGRTGLDGALAAYDQYRQYVSGDRQALAESEEAWDGLGDSIEGAGEHITDLGSPEGRAVYASLDELAQSIVPDLAAAFDNADGDVGKFRRSTDTLARQTLTRLQTEFNLSEADAKALFAELGLMPEQLTTYYELSGDEEAKLKLDLLQGSIDALPENVQTQVTQKILLGDYQGALAIIQRYYDQHGATVPVDADISRALDAIAQLRAAARLADIAINIGAQSTGYSVAPAAAATRGAAAPMGAATVAPINVHVHTAVVGDRYDVARVVGRAVRGAVRLSGTRK